MIQNSTLGLPPEDLRALEIAARTHWGLLKLQYDIQPPERQRAVQQAIGVTLGTLILAGLITYLVILPLSPAVGRAVLIVGGLSLAGVALLLTRPPEASDVASTLTAVREQRMAKAQGRISAQAAANRFGIELGIPLAQYEGRLIGLLVSAQQHVLFVAPTGTGKGFHLTTTLMYYPDSAFVVDPKGEQYERTAGLRAQQGQAVYRIPACSLDLAQFYDLTDPDDAATLHRQLIRPPSAGSENAIFYYKSLPLFEAIGHHARAAGRNPIRALIAASAAPMFTVLQKLDECPASHPFVRQFTDDIDPHDVDLLGGYKLTMNAWGTFTTALKPLVKHVDTIAPRPGAPNVIPPDWAEQGSTIYVTYDLNDLEAATGRLVSAVVAAVMRRRVRRSSDMHILLAIDELKAVRLQGLDTYLATMRSYNINFLLYVQDLAQLDAVYHIEARSILSNCASQVWYPTGEERTAQHMSQLYGTRLRPALDVSGMSLDLAQPRAPELRYSAQPAPAMDAAEFMGLPVGQVLVLMLTHERQYRFVAGRCGSPALFARLPPPVSTHTTRIAVPDWPRGDPEAALVPVSVSTPPPRSPRAVPAAAAAAVPVVTLPAAVVTPAATITAARSPAEAAPEGEPLPSAPQRLEQPPLFDVEPAGIPAGSKRRTRRSHGY